jgi:hypothetical protein
VRLILLLFTVLTCAAAAAGESTSSTWSMRWRTWCDPASGVSFRHPYLWLPEDMHAWHVDRERGRGGTLPVEIKEVMVDGHKATMTRPKRAHQDSDLDHDLTVFSEVSADNDLDAFGDRQARIPLQWVDWDYYHASPSRPQADPKQAPKDIRGRLGTSADRCALVLRHGDRISGLIFAGPADRESTRDIMDTVEIMAQPEKGRKGGPSTWRERMYRSGKVLGPDGKAMDPGRKAKPVPWTQGWEIETEHYHVTGHSSPARLLEHGAYLEALYRTYADLYEPDRMPPLKFEVHVFDLKKDFDAAAGSFGIPTGMGGGIMGGFFVPNLLSLWVYEESGRLGGPDFSVEHVTAHECSHQFLHLACNGSEHVPTWFNEGLAVYFESGIFKNNQFTVQPPRERISRLQMQYAQSRKMLVEPEWYLDHHGHIDASQYAEVYAMVHFWVFGQGKEGKNRFRSYWQALRGGEDGTIAFQRIFLDDMIKAKGSKEAALKAWQDCLLTYVKKNLK